MSSPHESMLLHAKRGLLVAVTANPLFYPGVMDVYDVTADCRTPVLKSSTPMGVLGHESGFSPDGLTFYSSSLYGNTVAAIDLTNPMAPVPLWVSGDYRSHGLTVSEDGKRLYMAETTSGNTGLTILDASEIQARKVNPTVKVVSRLTWPTVSTPQIAIPITIGGHPYIVEMDEFGGGAKVGAARIIDVADETKPKVISNIRLEVNSAEAQADASQNADNGGSNSLQDSLQGYDGHYCTVPQRVDPGVVACTFIASGLRLFDIRDPYAPKEIAYFNGPIGPALNRTEGPSAYAMSSAAFVPARGEIWYSDGNSGFWAFKVTNGVWPFANGSASVGGDATSGAVGSASAAAGGAGSTGRGRNGALPATGTRQVGALVTSGLALALVFGVRGVRRRLLDDAA
jgi:hypothetical protein